MKSLKLFRKNSFVLWVWLQHVKSPKSYTKNIKGSAPVQKFLTGVFLGPKILPISGVPCRNKSMTGQVIKIYQTFSFFFFLPEVSILKFPILSVNSTPSLTIQWIYSTVNHFPSFQMKHKCLGPVSRFILLFNY